MRHMNLGTTVSAEGQRHILGARTYVCTVTMNDGTQTTTQVEARDAQHARASLGTFNSDTQIASTECTNLAYLVPPPVPQ